MEAGQTVILLNFDKLYESLYDALNQYYSHYKEKRYVTLGLGTHKVKCKVHPNFRYVILIGQSYTTAESQPINVFTVIFILVTTFVEVVYR